MDKIEFIAKITHLTWVTYQIGAGQEYNIEINAEQLASLRDGVKFILKNPNVTPEENHNNWMIMKRSRGWKYGEIKDFEKKTHPDLIPYNALSDVEKRKDIMIEIIHKAALELWECIYNENDKNRNYK